ncbi:MULTISPECIES: hypothetical protein [unclassified Flavobacterium]|uniref:hypothetical protein n=1 Tax=unclassified Flavobacterium TaxID=196869 RepID=UPI003F8E63E3
MSDINSNTDLNPDIISIVTIHRKYNLEEELIEFLSQKGFTIELDSYKDDIEAPRLVMFVREQI